VIAKNAMSHENSQILCAHMPWPGHSICSKTEIRIGTVFCIVEIRTELLRLMSIYWNINLNKFLVLRFSDGNVNYKLSA